MRVVKGEKAEETFAILLIGDGRREERIISTLSEGYNHSKLLLIPTIGVRTGLTNVVDTLAWLTVNTRVKIYAVVIDKEHVETIDDVKLKLTEYGFSVDTLNKVANGLWKIKCSKGPKSVTLYLATTGLTPKGHIEENIAELIKLLYGETVKPDKAGINEWLRRHNLRDQELVKEALKRRRIKELKQAFPRLTALMEIMAKNEPLKCENKIGTPINNTC